LPINQQQPQQIQEQQQEVVQQAVARGATTEDDAMDTEYVDNCLVCLSIDDLTRTFMINLSGRLAAWNGWEYDCCA